jgi:uncharacterized membrane protein YccC
VRLSDPGHAALRRAGRVALVASGVFAWYLEVVDVPTAALFGAFAAFALLGFADFGGAAWPRSRAYLLLTFAGAALVLVGTVLNPYPVAAAVVAVAVAASVRFVGCFGGYFQASVSPLILAFVLGAMVPESDGSLGGRTLGWVSAGLLCTVAALVLWPRRERLVIRAAVGATALTLAEGVRAAAATGTVPASTARSIEAAAGAMERALAQPRRPAGPTAHDVTFAFAVDQVRRLATLVLETEDVPLPAGERAVELGTAAARVLEAAGLALRDGVEPAELAPAIEECVARRDAVVAGATARIAAGDDAHAVVDAIDAGATLRLVAYLAASLGANAFRLGGGESRTPDLGGPSSTPLEVPVGGFGGAVRRLRTLVATHLVPTSTWAQESVRAGLAVGVAVLIALQWDLEHGFWVVLGTLSVLRSNAFNTGRSALDAAVGTAIGFALSAGFLAVVGFDRAGLWVLLVAGFFLAAYTPQVIGFVVGQACFTVLVVALFNLIEPEGWRTGLVRVEDIAIGVSVSAVVALLFWPRRAVHELRVATAAVYQSLSSALGPAFRGTPDSAPVRRAERRAHAAYESFLSEQMAAPPEHRPWATILGTAAQGRGAIVALERHPDLAAIEAVDAVGDALGAAADDVATEFTGLAARMRARAPADPVGPPAPAAPGLEDLAARTREPVAACIAARAHDPGAGAALVAAFARDWLVALANLAGPTARAVEETRARGAPLVRWGPLGG